MTTRPFILALGLFGSSFAASAASSPSPYAGEESRQIAALSASEVESLLAGKGMGYAKAAELNGYPGPAHVLELAEELQLSAAQRGQTLAIFERMDSAAKTLGAQLVQAERALDNDFRQRRIDPASLAEALAKVAQLQGALRNVHLRAHLEQTAVLDPQQVENYVQLRGYQQRDGDHSGHH